MHSNQTEYNALNYRNHLDQDQHSQEIPHSLTHTHTGMFEQTQEWKAQIPSSGTLIQNQGGQPGPRESDILRSRTINPPPGFGFSHLTPQPLRVSGWESRSSNFDRFQRNDNVDPVRVHRELFQRVDQSVIGSFAKIKSALEVLESEIRGKISHMYLDQYYALDRLGPGLIEVDEFETNVRKIERSLESFTAHADNLSHIKLTLSRAAVLVSPDNNLNNLIPKNQIHRAQSQNTLLSQSQDPRFQEPQSQDPRFQESQSQDQRFQVQHSHSPGILSQRQRFQGILSREPESVSVSVSVPVSTKRISGTKPNNWCTCFVFYLPPTATSDTLRGLFMQCGTVLNAYVVMDKETNRSRGFGFVDFSKPGEAQSACEKLNGCPLDGKFLSVSIKV